MLSRMMRQLLSAGAMLSMALGGVVAASEPGEIESTNYTEGAAAEPSSAPGICRIGQCGPQEVRAAACDPRTGCMTGACNAFAYGAHQPSAECYAGKPYTFGDLACDMRAMKSNAGLGDGCDSCGMGSALHNWWCQEKFKMRCRNAYRNQVLGAHLHNKLNYFVPSGNGGEGIPLVGFYRRVYATSPGYYDARDKQIYAAPEVGVPVSVPLAPGVRYQYNYGWGTPASRITPISTISPPRY